ncbi:glycoside hydrolase family 47 protein [Trichoderma citrinoviride]|uniref:alpha-1,2-Mannosidase n=1 Tax=Trichoderma citrinoviride TaxID=58853 RepID=A0A2T4BIR1_9HYPO|nr:glycoside hydrolase family 47 protein [Trichoderma citrinoviride]PTB69206.1 glycoside hydrolase family 47 protein [Trichoderma citrinoviride]
MARRRYRLFMICAVVILFLLYRVSQNTWDDSAHYTSLRHPPASNPPAAGGEVPLKPAAKPEHEYTPEAKPKPQSEPEPESKPAPEHAAGGQKAQAKPSYDDEEETGKNPPKDAVIPEDNRLPPDTRVHWRPQKEHFPVPSESVISLPTGKPLKVPRVQHEFGVESPEAKSRRVTRQERVAKEIERAWSGYKKFAWMHDELSPVSAKHRDPFCGWAATLVDSLDTLWIAGLREEFDEAARAVEQIDFTTTPRNNIPVFETTIRYLGGLLGAFDVSGGHDGGYPILLEKAVELAEILMGIFDTPNRMPLLYYQWQPEYASQPHRAGSVGIAELGTLSMEFTRLAQLTSEYKYYDAVDRITDALVELQKQGTSIPGLFPESLDASGCNHTATALRSSLSQAAQKQMDDDLSKKPENYIPGKGTKTGPQTVEKQPAEKQNVSASENEPVEKAKQVPPQQTAKRGAPPFGADGFTANWDCVPQGLVVSGYGFQQYHMGGGQDSAYEYFPKEYLLLGGLESKYQKLYVDAVEAINEWLLYRPMTDGDWDILFPAKVSTSGNPSQDLVATFEVTHLTCFIGGMYGLGGKIFGREKDLETAKRLTDGCVWAYQSTVSGIMPEGSQVMACPTLEKCEFNETLWWEKLDGAKDWRDKQVADDKDKAAAGEALKETASNHEAAGGSKAIHKRAAVLPPKSGADENVGSELPQSLKDKIGFKNDEQKKPTESSVGIQRDPDAPVDSVLEAHRLPPQEPEEQQIVLPEKPQSHEEFVKQRIADMGLAPGVVHISSRQYILRPEAIESVWYMYRITGDPIWMEKGWKMFEATIRATRTEIANSAIDDVNSDEPGLKDEMESFWLAETLKYYYLLFSEPSVISLDEWVLNTEAHPFKRPGGSVIGHSI